MLDIPPPQLVWCPVLDEKGVEMKAKVRFVVELDWELAVQLEKKVGNERGALTQFVKQAVIDKLKVKS